MERRRREWDGDVTRTDAERLVKISMEIHLLEDDLQDVRKGDEQLYP